jgi:hypothetical protein
LCLRAQEKPVVAKTLEKHPTLLEKDLKKKKKKKKKKKRKEKTGKRLKTRLLPTKGLGRALLVVKSQETHLLLTKT